MGCLKHYIDMPVRSEPVGRANYLTTMLCMTWSRIRFPETGCVMFEIFLPLGRLGMVSALF